MILSGANPAGILPSCTNEWRVIERWRAILLFGTGRKAQCTGRIGNDVIIVPAMRGFGRQAKAQMPAHTTQFCRRHS